MGHKVPQSQYFHGLWHSFFFSTVKDGILTQRGLFFHTKRVPLAELSRLFIKREIYKIHAAIRQSFVFTLL